MSHLIDSLHRRRRAVWNSARQILDAADGAGRPLTDSEARSYTALIGEVDELDIRLEELDETERRSRDLDRAFSSIPADNPVDSTVRSLLAGESRNLTVPLAAALERRDLLKSGTASHAVPQGFAGELLAHLVNAAQVAAVSRTVSTDRGVGDWKLPISTAHVTATGPIAEGAAITESEPTLSSVTLAAYKYATLVQVSAEALDDSGVDLEGYLAQSAGEAVGNALGAHLVTGSGSSQPQGAATAATVAKTAASASAITYGELVDLVHSVIPRYRASSSAAFLMSDSTVGYLRKLVDGQQRPIWTDSITQGQPATLLGYPVVVDPNVAAIGAGARSVLFGDWSRYVVRFAGGVRFERSDEFAFSSDVVTFRCVLRADGRLADVSAIKALIHP